MTATLAQDHRGGAVADLQLTIEGREIPVDHMPANPAHPAPLSASQRAILAHIHAEGAITSTEAGVIVHRFRPWPQASRVAATGGRCPSHGAALSPEAIGCCVYAAADGGAAMKLLARRGLVFRSMVGLWEPTR